MINLSSVAGRYAVKSGIVANRRRAQRGLPPKEADGRVDTYHMPTVRREVSPRVWRRGESLSVNIVTGIM